MEPDPRAPFTFTPIGVIHTPFREAAGTPIQPVCAGGARGSVEVYSSYTDGLRDLDGFERIWLIYRFDRAGATRLRVVPFRDTAERGVFATRAPCRPNGIGMSCVRLLSVDGSVLTVDGVDMLDGTPLLDIKPYVPEFDAFPDSLAGWVGASASTQTHADNRFHPAQASPVKKQGDASEDL
jgi:tRNA-Thr(GGU) m(6)t(6)A37 methyltransferase TsaA